MPGSFGLPTGEPVMPTAWELAQDCPFRGLALSDASHSSLVWYRVRGWSLCQW